MQQQLLNEKTDDLLENARFISRHANPNTNTLRLFKADNPNYAGYYRSEEFTLELKEQMESLQLVAQYIKENHSFRPAEVNYFLDDSSLELEKTEEELAQFQQPNLYGACTRDTWSKGHQFFYIDAGQLLKIRNVKNNYATIEYEHQLGILHINDIKVYGQME